MNRGRSPAGWRASALAVALFAITLDFLQPLAHAALMRDGPAATLWNVICSASAAHSDHDKSSPPVTANAHTCCLGLAHAVAFSAPPAALIMVARVSVAAALLPTDVQPSTAGIRDGPGQPRGPPFPS